MKHSDYRLLTAKRNKDIFAYYLSHTELTMAEVGEKFDGLSKQRVQQIIEEEKKATGKSRAS